MKISSKFINKALFCSCNVFFTSDNNSRDKGPLWSLKLRQPTKAPLPHLATRTRNRQCRPWWTIAASSPLAGESWPLVTSGPRPETIAKRRKLPLGRALQTSSRQGKGRKEKEERIVRFRSETRGFFLSDFSFSVGLFLILLLLSSLFGISVFRVMIRLGLEWNIFHFV